MQIEAHSKAAAKKNNNPQLRTSFAHESAHQAEIQSYVIDTRRCINFKVKLISDAAFNASIGRHEAHVNEAAHLVVFAELVVAQLDSLQTENNTVRDCERM